MSAARELEARYGVERLLMIEYKAALGRLLKAERKLGCEIAGNELASVSRLEEALDSLQAWEPKP